MQKPLVIGIAGGTGAGKTTVAYKIQQYFNSKILFISHDNYYRDESALSFKEREKINYDHPNSLETDLLVTHVKNLLSGKTIQIPTYDFTQHNRAKETITAKVRPIILLEGILVFENKALRDLMDLKIFVDTDADIRLGRRIMRDIKERGRTLEFSLNQYLTMSKPMHEAFVEPSKRYADLIVPWVNMNDIAIDMIIRSIEKLLE